MIKASGVSDAALPRSRILYFSERNYLAYVASIVIIRRQCH